MVVHPDQIRVLCILLLIIFLCHIQDFVFESKGRNFKVKLFKTYSSNETNLYEIFETKLPVFLEKLLKDSKRTLLLIRLFISLFNTFYSK